MPVPDFQSLMLPALRAVEDGKTHTSAEINEAVATSFSLSDADLSELLPSGKAKLYYNRMGWAKQHLVWAGLLAQPKRAYYEITDSGRSVLADASMERLTVKYLERFPGFREVQLRSRARRDVVAPPRRTGETEPGTDPREAIEIGYEQIRGQLAHELLKQAKTCSPEFFEQLVVDLLVAMGYGGSRADAGRAVGRSGDEGIDGIIKEDRLGLDAVYVQAKRWEATVGRPVLQAFAGSLEGQRARKGVFITTSTFSKDARDYAERIEKKIVLIDGASLAELMIDYGVGVTEVASYSIKRLDTDYFESGDL